MKKKISVLYILFFLISISMGSLAQKNNVIFTDVTKQAGINFKYNFGDDVYKNILQSSGSGITIFDYNNDGLMDLYLMNGTYIEGISDPEGKIYKNSS